MSRTLHHPLSSPRPSRLRRAIAWMRDEHVGAPTILTLAWAFTVAMSALLLWAGVTLGAVRAVLLLLAGCAGYMRRPIARLAAVAPSAPEAESPRRPGKSRGWHDIAQEALVLLAAGLCAYGSKSWLGPAFGVIAAALLVAGRLVAHKRSAFVTRSKLDPVLAVAAFALLAAIEPLWGWRGQSIVIGLFLIAAVLAARLVRLSRPSA